MKPETTPDHPEDEYKNPDAIWLQPWCADCDHHSFREGRQWCQDEVWEKCEECGRKPIKYVRVA